MVHFSSYWKISLWGMTLAAAGLPLYIHFPHFATTQLGLSLGWVGVMLTVLRVVDMAQDPFLGWVAQRDIVPRPILAALVALGLGLGGVMLFAVPPIGTPELWSVIWLIVTFSAYSLGMILVYGQTHVWSGEDTVTGQLHVATYRELGLLGGVVILGMTPTVAASVWGADRAYVAVGAVIAGLALIAVLVQRGMWTGKAAAIPKMPWRAVMAHGTWRLLILAWVNSLPVALTSTVFVFYVEDRLQLHGLSGPLLITFFLSSAASIPLWSKLAKSWGTRPTLATAMAMALGCLCFALPMGAGDLWPYVIICITTGFAIGADLVILPSLFTAHLARNHLPSTQAFGLWNFAVKLALVGAALIALPVLDLVGFQSGGENSAQALSALSWVYAGVPAALKLLALFWVLRLPSDLFDGQPQEVLT